MGYLYEVLFAGVETVVLQWIIRGFAVMICGLVCFLLYRFYGKVRPLCQPAIAAVITCSL